MHDRAPRTAAPKVQPKPAAVKVNQTAVLNNLPSTFRTLSGPPKKRKAAKAAPEPNKKALISKLFESGDNSLYSFFNK